MKTIGSLRDGDTTKALDNISILTCVSLIPENPAYSKLAAAILAEYIRKEVVNQGIQSFDQSIIAGYNLGLVSSDLQNFVAANVRKLNNAVKDVNNAHFEYFGLKSVYDKHLLRHPETNEVIETPQMMFMRIAAADAKSAKAATERYKHIATSGHKEKVLLDGWFQQGTVAYQEQSKAWAQKAIAHAGGPVLTEKAATPFFRPLKGGMGQAVAERTVLRKKPDGSWETWGDVAERVARGNAMLASTPTHSSEVFFCEVTTAS